MAESTLTLTFSNLQVAVARYLGYSVTAADWTTPQAAEIAGIVQSGLRQFYWPPVPADRPDAHRWSFLRPTTTLSTASGTFNYALPDNFGGELSDFTYASGTSHFRVPIIPLPDLLALIAGGTGATNAAPKYAALRPLTSDSTAGQRFEVVTYPTADAIYVLTYSYDLLPSALVASTAEYALGGAAHSETILQSCVAVAEQRSNDTAGIHQARWSERLAESIRYDRKFSAVTEPVSYPLTGLTATLGLTYPDLQSEVGQLLGYGWDPRQFNHVQSGVVDKIIQNGLRDFYNPSPVLTGGRGVEWSFLRVNATLATVAGTYAYDLPAGCSNLDGPSLCFAITDNQRGPVRLVGEGVIRHKQEMNDSSAAPQLAAVRPKATPVDGSALPVQELLLWPTPNAVYPLGYRYYVQPLKLSAANPYPLGGLTHSETVLEACLAAAERHVGKEGVHTAQFQRRLMASVASDGRSTPASLGYNGDRSDFQHGRPFQTNLGRGLYNGNTY